MMENFVVYVGGAVVVLGVLNAVRVFNRRFW